MVVENDESSQLEGQLSEWREWFPFPLHHVLEVERGISFARNRIVQESRRLGTTTGLCEREIIPLTHWMPMRIVKACWYVMQGMLYALASWYSGHFLLKAIATISQGLGMLLGLLGVTYQEYRQTHGS